MMKIKGLIHQFKNYYDLRYGAIKKHEKNYDKESIKRFVEMVANGSTIKKAAGIEGIPMGSAFKYVPESAKRNHLRPLALKLAKQKMEGTLNITLKSIGEQTNYSPYAIGRMIKKIKEGYIYEELV